MGLFGSIFKLGKGLARAALSKATGGVSEQVLKKLKGRGQVKMVTAKTGMPPTEQEKALVNKAFPDEYNPSVKQTEQVLAGVKARAEGKRVGKGGRTGKTKPRGVMVTIQDAYDGTWKTVEEDSDEYDEIMQHDAGEWGKTPATKRYVSPNVAWRAARKAKKGKVKGLTKSGKPRKPPSPAQLAARARFVAMVRAKRKG